jgi:hypothetical protein
VRGEKLCAGIVVRGVPVIGPRAIWERQLLGSSAVLSPADQRRQCLVVDPGNTLADPQLCQLRDLTGRNSEQPTRCEVTARCLCQPTRALLRRAVGKWDAGVKRATAQWHVVGLVWGGDGRPRHRHEKRLEIGRQESEKKKRSPQGPKCRVALT